MKKILLPLLFFVSQLINSQSQWRPLGTDDFNQPSYGGVGDNTNSDSKFNKICVKNGTIYSMNIELGDVSDAYWFVLGKYTNGSWQHIETPFKSNSITASSYYSLAIDTNETPYLFFNDPLNGHKPTVKKFDGTTWVTVGNGAFSNSSSSINEIAIGSDNLPVVLYMEGNSVYVKKFNGTDWIAIPSDDLLNFKKAYLKLDSNNTPYVLYHYTTSSYDDYSKLRKFNGNSWEEVGVTNFGGPARGLCLDSNNFPYIFTGSYVRKFDGTSWQIIYDWIPDNPGPAIYGVTNGSLAMDTDNNLYICYKPIYNSTNWYVDKRLANGSVQYLSPSVFGPNMSIAVDGTTLYRQYSYPDFPTVEKIVGTTWEKCGIRSQIFDYGKLSDLSISNGVPILALKDKTSLELNVVEFVNGSWSANGTSISEATISNLAIETDTNGTPYIAYTNLQNSTEFPTQTKITVKKRVGNSWNLVGPLNFSAASETYMDFKINHQNVPYVVYKSGNVQKFNGTSWEFVGSPAYSGEKKVQLAFDTNDVPYLLYLNPAPTVVKFNGTSWENVGVASLAAFQNVLYPQIICDSSNNMFIGFVETNKKINILKWDGTSWQPLSNQLITSESFLKLTIDKFDTPVIMFNKSDTFRYMANVSKFNGSNWEAIGEPDFSPEGISGGNIIFTDSNVPLVTYTNTSNFGGIYSKYYGETGNPLGVGNQPTVTNQQLIISPNPVNAVFSLNLDEDIRAVDLFDLTGKKVFSDTGKKEIDISALQSGLYLIKVKTDTGNYTAKIIKK